MPPALKQGVTTLFGETAKYLSSSPVVNITPKASSKVLEDLSNVASPDTSDIKPFTPLRLPDFSKLKQTPQSAKIMNRRSLSTGRRSSRRVLNSSTPKTGASAKVPRTPRTVDSLRIKEVDLRKSLLKSKDKLRQTPGLKRSPGRTPAKKKRVLDMRDQSDLVTYALRRKFQQVRNLYGSPGGDADSSINISID